MMTTEPKLATSQIRISEFKVNKKSGRVLSILFCDSVDLALSFPEVINRAVSMADNVMTA